MNLEKYSLNKLISVSKDRSIRIWNVITGLNEVTIENAHNLTIKQSLVLNPNKILTTGDDGVLKLWNPTSNWVGKEVLKLSSILNYMCLIKPNLICISSVSG